MGTVVMAVQWRAHMETVVMAVQWRAHMETVVMADSGHGRAMEGTHGDSGHGRAMEGTHGDSGHGRAMEGITHGDSPQGDQSAVNPIPNPSPPPNVDQSGAVGLSSEPLPTGAQPPSSTARVQAPDAPPPSEAKHRDNRTYSSTQPTLASLSKQTQIGDPLLSNCFSQTVMDRVRRRELEAAAAAKIWLDIADMLRSASQPDQAEMMDALTQIQGSQERASLK
eukprot:TRINITY_DN5849_c0_g1_i9.p1 TRINITY_DN5849_c0_g1~~TRINITY_DN5849_c0_g1_i9.p1  ORF type:complete len:223 (-),score=35.78 TRINITY_DN5849_c0_g1_i9:61-729(-)